MTLPFKSGGVKGENYTKRTSRVSIFLNVMYVNTCYIRNKLVAFISHLVLELLGRKMQRRLF